MKKLYYLENLEIFLIFLLVFLFVRIFIFEPFIVIGESMEPNFHNADYLIICKICTKLQKLERFDVVIFTPPIDRGKYYIKRIIGLPGEKIVLKEDGIYIYNQENPQGFKLEEPFLNYDQGYLESEYLLKENEYFVLGDNREQSYDSRKFGPIDKERIIGKVIIKIGLLGNLIKIVRLRNI